MGRAGTSERQTGGLPQHGRGLRTGEEAGRARRSPPWPGGLRISLASPSWFCAGQPNETRPARSPACRTIPAVVSLADEELSLGLSKACVRRSALLVSTDSGPRHFAAAFRVPVITLFGPTHIAWTRTYHPRAIHLFQPVPCGPCQKSICPEGHHRCMRELDPEKVYDAAIRLMSVDYPFRAAASGKAASGSPGDGVRRL